MGIAVGNPSAIDGVLVHLELPVYPAVLRRSDAKQVLDAVVKRVAVNVMYDAAPRNSPPIKFINVPMEDSLPPAPAMLPMVEVIRVLALRIASINAPVKLNFVSHNTSFDPSSSTRFHPSAV